MSSRSPNIPAYVVVVKAMRKEKGRQQLPLGGLYKDSRRNIRGDKHFNDKEDQWTQVINNKPKSPQATGSGSAQPAGYNIMHSRGNWIWLWATTAQPAGNHKHLYSSRIRRSSRRKSKETTKREKNLERVFVTPPPEGGFRDNLIIEIRQVNGEPFRGSLHFKEAKFGIFEQTLKQDPALIHGISFGFSDFPLVKFKLRKQINIDEFQPVEFFEFKRTYKTGNEYKSDILSCKIKGIRADASETREQPDEDPNIRWVKVEGCDYSIEEGKIVEWLKMYGDPIDVLTEDLHQDTDSDTDPTGNGTYSIKMRLHSNIPQLLPMWGRRIRIYHRGIQKLCTNCFGNHTRRACKSKKGRWIDYVLRFMENNPEIPMELYGRWKKVIDQEFGEIVDQPNGEAMWEDQYEDATPQEVSTVNEQSNAGPTTSTTNIIQPPAPTPMAAERSTLKPITQMTEEEEDELAEYLNIGMTLAEARQMKANEKRLAEVKLQIREQRRATERGAIRGRGTRAAPTRYGQGASQRGSGRGLTFN